MGLMYKELIKNMKLIVYDFDGVMTDNMAYVNQEGVESVRVNRGDGLGISGIKQLGLFQIIVSTETNPVVAARAEKLNIECYHGVRDKLSCIQEYSVENAIAFQQIAFVGNDINDLEAMQAVGLKICPSDARPEIIQISDIILDCKGGSGVVREIFDLIKEARINS